MGLSWPGSSLCMILRLTSGVMYSEDLGPRSHAQWGYWSKESCTVRILVQGVMHSEDLDPRSHAQWESWSNESCTVRILVQGVMHSEDLGPIKESCTVRTLVRGVMHSDSIMRYPAPGVYSLYVLLSFWCPLRQCILLTERLVYSHAITWLLCLILLHVHYIL